MAKECTSTVKSLFKVTWTELITFEDRKSVKVFCAAKYLLEGRLNPHCRLLSYCY